MAAEMVTENGAETTTQMEAETGGYRLKDAEKLVNTALKSVLEKLCEGIASPAETDPESEESQRKIKFKFERFNDKNWCQSFQGIPIDEFKEFAYGLEKKLNLPDGVAYSLLNGSVSAENEVRDDCFPFEDGKGEIRLGRFVTINRNVKIDIAYAIYTLSFELVKNETWCFKWWYIFPVGWEYKKEAQTLSEEQKDLFMRRCEQKLYKRVAQKCSKE